MSEQYSSFEFDREEATPFSFDIKDKDERDLALEILMAGEAGWWIAERIERYAEVAKPIFMYVKDLGDENAHRVLYLEHHGLLVEEGARPQACTAHHVICDCVDLNERGILPESVGNCDILRDVRFQHAASISGSLGMADIIKFYTEFDDEILDFKLTKEGETLAIAALENIVRSHSAKPELWVGNEVGGIHEVSVLATAINQSEDQVYPLLERMHNQGIVNFDGALVTLAA